jgi:hypothetical protein
MLGPAGTCFAASASISGLRSVPTTTPVVPTTDAAVRATMPVQRATSRARSPAVVAQLIESIGSANLDPLTRGTLGFELGVLTASFDVGQFSLAEQRRRLIYRMAGLANFADSVRAGDLYAALVASRRIHGSFTGNEFMSAYISRLLECQQDIAFSTPFGPSNPAFGPQVVFGHMHDEPLSGEHVGNAIRLRPEIGILCAVADAAWRAALPPTSIRSETV